ncbi:Ribonuclease H-like protein [Colletotrichum tabaci]|uniref:Ribonuclease H-like protein n=1 Tax=Colletotrichum tabaci TaxID=1209068 RepID=A0AAV9ST64_9PEZI
MTDNSTAIALSDLLSPEGFDEDPIDPKHLDGYPFYVLQACDEDEPSVKADISDHWGADYRAKIQKVINDCIYLFCPGIGKFNDGIEMPIPFKDGVDISDLNQRPYNMSRRDKVAMDAILNPLAEAGIVEKVPLGEPSPSAAPAFMVWRNGKPRMVIDLRRVNTKLLMDAYPLPREDDILGHLQGSVIFTIMDVTKGFFQQDILAEDSWKTSFVTPYCGHERLTVSSMGLATSLAFF